jgi:hypothetical protein
VFMQIRLEPTVPADDTEMTVNRQTRGQAIHAKIRHALLCIPRCEACILTSKEARFDQVRSCSTSGCDIPCPDCYSHSILWTCVGMV